MIHYNYITINKINGKRYVGARSTKKDINKDAYLGSGILFKKIVKKFGRENFIKEILCKTKTRLEAEYNEEYFINKYNTLVPNGYNIDPNGGSINGKTGRKCSKGTRKKMRENHADRKGKNNGMYRNGYLLLGEKNGMYGKSLFDLWVEKYGIYEAIKRQKERDKKISESLKGNKPWSKGLTKEVDLRVKKMSESKKGQISWNKGLTKGTDERVKRAAKKRSKSLLGMKYKKRVA